MANYRYNGDTPRRGGPRKDAIGTNQPGEAKVGKQEHHGGAKDGPSDLTPNSRNVEKGLMCGFGEKKSRKGIGGVATRGF